MAGDKELGGLIREAIRTRGVSVDTVAKQLGHSNTWLYRVMNGKRGISYGDLQELQDYLGVRLAPGVHAPTSVIGIGNADRAGPLTAIAVVDQEVSASLRGGAVEDAMRRVEEHFAL